MLKDVLYRSRVLDGLFVESDFAFLNEADNEISELNRYLKKQKMNREHIISFVENFDNMQGFDNNVLNEAKEMFELVNANIKNIYNLQEQFQQLEKIIVEFIVDLENGNNSTNSSISDIKLKINLYSNLYKDIKNHIILNDGKIDQFLNKINIKTEAPIADRTIVINLNDTAAVKNMENDIQDNLKLLISEKQKKVFLPYTGNEVLEFIKKYPNEYSSAKDVIEQEFIVPISSYSKHPTLARFREAYSLIRDREMKSVVDAFKYAIDLMFKYELNPAIIAACKSEKQLNEYLECLSSNTLDNFKYFKIEFEVSPYAVKNKKLY